MKRRSNCLMVLALLVALLPAASVWARGFRGFHGGGFDRGGFGGGGFHEDESGGGNRDFGGLNSGGNRTDGWGEPRLGQFDSSRFGGQQFGAGRLSNAGFGSQLDRFQGSLGGQFLGSPSRNQLSSFLGMSASGGFRSADAGDFDVQRGGVEGPRGGEAARGVAVGPNGGVAAGRGAVGPGGAAAGQGLVVGPDGRVAGGSAVRGTAGGVAGHGFVAGPGGVAAGYARVSPAGTYAGAAAVRNFSHYGIYGAGWYGAHPGAWLATGWAAGTAWNAATWAGLGNWFGYGGGVPAYYYNYGNNIVYQNGNVYVGGELDGTSAEYYDQAASLASAGSQSPPSDADWLPLGVFSLSPAGQKQSNIVVQLALDKQGILRGNYTDTFSDQPVAIHGSVDKKTQRVAWIVGENKHDVFETGLYNLTKSQAPVLVHFGQQRTEQWLLVRLKQPAGGSQPAGEADQTAAQPPAE